MRLPAYPRYKQSGVDWLGDVPEHWKLGRLRETARLINGYPFDSDLFSQSEGVPLVRIRDIYSGSTEVLWSGQPIEAAAIFNGDILVGMDGDFNVAWWNGGRAMLNQRVCCLRSRPSLLVQRFLYYVLAFPLKALNDITYSTTVKHLSSLDLLRFRLLLPTLEEQRAIADFLDRETAQIDTLVAKKQTLIERLKEERTALISRTVTRGLPVAAACAAGLDPHPVLKSSGIDSLGDVPAHWQVQRLGYLAAKVGSGKTPKGGAETYQSDGVLLLRSQNVHDAGLRLGDVVYIDEAVDAEMGNTRVLPGDVLLNITGASLGRCSIAPNGLPPANVNQHVCIIRVQKTAACSRFVHHTICSRPLQEQMFAFETGSSREGLNFQQVRSLFLALPPNAEQVAIADFLDRKTVQIDGMVDKIETAINRLDEYRTALITAAVTGKFDARWAAA